jgi:Glycosyl hydrolase family 1
VIRSYLDTPDESSRVPDNRRTAFHSEHLAELARAIADGANVRAYHAWSLVDNFEWSDGYSQRYGLTYVDFRNQRRTVVLSMSALAIVPQQTLFVSQSLHRLNAGGSACRSPTGKDCDGQQQRPGAGEGD